MLVFRRVPVETVCFRLQIYQPLDGDLDGESSRGKDGHGDLLLHRPDKNTLQALSRPGVQLVESKQGCEVRWHCLPH